MYLRFSQYRAFCCWVSFIFHYSFLILHDAKITTNQISAQAVHSTPSSSPKEKNPYVLPVFDTKKITHMKTTSKKYDRCWDKHSVYRICLKRTPTEDYLNWIGREIPLTVQMKNKKCGSFHQKWQFLDADISFYRGADGKIGNTNLGLSG